jgi:hypothetical protein
MLTLFTRVCTSLSESDSVVSSANKSEKRLLDFGKSFMSIKNNRGPKMDPCGSPLSDRRQELEAPFIFTYCSLSFR